MSIFNDFKKLFFGAKAVGKSVAESAKEKGREVLNELENNSANVVEKAKDIAEDLSDKAKDVAESIGKKIIEVTGVTPKETPQGGDVMDEILKEKENDESPTLEELELPPIDHLSAKKTAPSPHSNELKEQRPSLTMDQNKMTVNEEMERAGDFVEKIGEQVKETGNTLLEKMGEKADVIGERLFTVGEKAIEKAQEITEDLGTKLIKAKDELLKKADEESAKSGAPSQDLADKLAEINQRIKDAISGNNTKFSDKPLDLGGSELEKHQSFFEKAKRFAEGDYQSKKPKISMDQPQENIKPGNVKGFDDLDGDGDEIIDDAIIDKS